MSAHGADAQSDSERVLAMLAARSALPQRQAREREDGHVRLTGGDPRAAKFGRPNLVGQTRFQTLEGGVQGAQFWVVFGGEFVGCAAGGFGYLSRPEPLCLRRAVSC